MTPRQTEVASLVVEGKRNKEIAKALGIAPDTVETHLRDLFRIFNVDNRTKLAVMLDRATRTPK